MLIDTTPLHVIGAYTVIAEQHPVQFRDGTTIGLHLVHVAGKPAMFLRCFVHDGLHAMVLDLRHLHGLLESEILQHPARDAHGLVLCHLRAKYPTQAQFAAAAMAHLKAAKLLDKVPRQAELNLVYMSGHVDALSEADHNNRRFWALHLPQDAAAA